MFKDWQDLSRVNSVESRAEKLASPARAKQFLRHHLQGQVGSTAFDDGKSYKSYHGFAAFTWAKAQCPGESKTPASRPSLAERVLAPGHRASAIFPRRAIL